MKKLLLMLGLAMAAIVAPVAAQDCCPQYDACCDEVGFEGLYFGGNIGVFTHTVFRTGFGFDPIDDRTITFNNTNVTLGLQLGYDWLCCYKLFGLVVDWNWVNIDRRFDSDFEEGGRFTRGSFDWFTTIRGRAGLAVCDALVYVTLGAAVANFDNRFDTEADDGFFNHNHTRWGWVGGVGTEFILGCNWSIGLEVLYLQFSHRNRAIVDSSETFSTLGFSDAAYVGRFLLNYRFGDLCACWGR